MAEKLWKGTNHLVGYEEFKSICQKAPEAPGVNLRAQIAQYARLTIPDKEYRLNGTDTLYTSVPEIGYPYAVSFSVCPNKDTNVSGVLFKGPHATVYANWENTGRIAFSRDGYTFVFGSYQLPEETWTDIRIEGDWKGTTLFINGKQQERLEGRQKKVYHKRYRQMEYMNYQETLVFPLQQIGDTLNGFQGKIRNVTCNHKNDVRSSEK